MKEISSLNNEYIKELSKLKDRKYLDKSDCFLVEGKHLVSEAYKHNSLVQILTSEEIIGFDNIDTIKVTNEIIKKITDTVNPQTIVGKVKKFKNNDSLVNVKSILILDGVSDPGNMGTIIRTSAGLGIDLLVLGEDCVDIYNPKVVRATQGAIFALNTLRTNLSNYILKLKENGFKVYGTSLKEAIDLKEVKCDEKYAIVLGNESLGVKEEILKICDQNVKIDITNNVESLNVAIAGAIIMYQFKK